jgi:signal peptidase II
MKKRAILLTLLILTLIIFDQLTKWLVITNIKENSITVIQNILNFTYVENKGVAFGINSNGGISNIIISIFIIIIIIRFMVKMTNKFTNISLALILAGGFGNLIDRIFRGRVIDFIDISPVFNFPTFNIADILVVIGWIAFALNMAIYTTRELKNLKKELK